MFKGDPCRVCDHMSAGLISICCASVDCEGWASPVCSKSAAEGVQMPSAPLVLVV